MTLIPQSETIQNPVASSRLKSFQTAAYFAIFIGLGMTAASLGPTLPGLAAHTDSDLGQISFLFTARALGYLLGSLRGGRAYDRLPGHPLIGVLLLVMGALVALIPLSAQLWLVTLLLFAVSLAEGAVDVGGNTLLVWVHQKNVGPYMNALHFFFGVGALIAPLIAAQALLRTNDINWVYWLLAAYLLPMALIAFRLPSPKAPPAIQNNPNSITQPGLVALMVLFFVVYVGAESSYGGWVFTYATVKGLADPAGAAYLTSLYWGLFTAGRLISIGLSARLKPQSMLVADLAGCLLSVSLILAFPDSLAALGIGTAGLGLATASMFPSMLVYAEKRMALSGRITSWFFVGAGIGGMILPWLTGQLFDQIGPGAAMWAIFIDLIVIAFVFAAIRAYNQRSAAQA